MNTRPLGRTGLQVSQLGAGGLFLSSFGGEFEQSRQALCRALALGVNYIDTAPTYGNSEEVIGKILADVSAPVVLSTKLGGRPQPFNPRDKACLRRSVEESLRLLGRDRIDILMIHEPDRPKVYDWWTDPVAYQGPVLEFLDDLKREGLIRFTGLGGVTAYEIAPIIRTGKFDVVLTAGNYSLLWREAEREVLPAAKEHNVGVIIGSPLQQGSLARRYDDEIRHGARWLSPPRRQQFQALYDFLDELQLPIAEVGLRFVISNPIVSCVLMGARSVQEVEQNAAAIANGPLSPAILQRLNEIAARAPFAPAASRPSSCRWGNGEMLFQHSAVSGVTAWDCTEQHPTLPLDIHPAYLGSGPVAFALDATGMQGLDSRIMEQPEIIGMLHAPGHLSDDLHLYHAATLSHHHLAEARRFGADTSAVFKGWSQVPAGYLDYRLTLDGETWDAERLAREAVDWRRVFRPRTGSVCTAFRLRGVEVAWDTTIGQRSALALFGLTLTSLDAIAHAATLTVRIHLATRSGVELATGGLTTRLTPAHASVHWAAAADTSSAPVKEPYQFVWGLALSRPARAEWQSPVLSLAADLSVAAGGTVTLPCAVYLGCSQSDTGTLAQAERELASFTADPDRAGALAHDSWGAFYDGAATFAIGFPQLEFLYHASQYLLAAGGDWAWGLPSNYLWNCNWGGAVFWDMHFAMDGMLRAGHQALVRPFLGWLTRVAARSQPGERPFYFVHDYDGDRPWGDDPAYQVMAAYAGAAIRYYETTHDQEALRRWVYPVLKRVADYTRQQLVSLQNGQWRFRVPVANDVGVPAAGDAAETGILAWLVTALAKAAEYGQALGEPDAVLAPWREVVAATRQAPYDWSQPMMWWTWLPHLTAAEPFYRKETWIAGVKRDRLAAPAPTARYIEDPCALLRYVEGDFPWFQFSMAASYSLLGLADAGWEYLQAGLRGVYGLGVFSEVRYDFGLCVANAPFMGGTGAYLSAIAGLFVNSTIWDNAVRVLDVLPLHLQRRSVSFTNFRSLNGARVSATYTPAAITVAIDSAVPRPVILGIPIRLRGVPWQLTRNGQPATGVPAADGKTLAVDVPAGATRIELTEDRDTAFDVVLFEEKARAAVFQTLFAEQDLAVRLVRDPRALPPALATARVAVVPGSLVSLPAFLALALEAFVERGGCLIGLHHAGCAAINPRIAAVLGVNGDSEDRFKNQFRPFSYSVVADHPLTAGLPRSFAIEEADRILTPRLAADVTVLAVNGETGDAVATVRQVGARGGCAIWFAPGQDAAGRQPQYQGWSTDTLRVAGVRIDEVFSYPYLKSAPVRRFLGNAVRFGLDRRGAPPA